MKKPPAMTRKGSQVQCEVHLEVPELHLHFHELGVGSVDVDRLAHYFRMRSEMRTNISSWRKSPFLLTLFQGSVGSTSVIS